MFPILTNSFLLSGSIIFLFIVVRTFLYRTALILLLKKWLHSIEDRVHVHQFFKIPQFNDENTLHNQFYGKVSTYLSSLASLEESNFTNLFAGKKSNDIILCLDDNQTVHDEFLGARITWKNHVERDDDRQKRKMFVLRIKKKDKRRILKPYIQHIHTVSDEIEQNTRRRRKLYINVKPGDDQGNGRWRSIPLTHPSTIDTLAMDLDLKNKAKSDLESFLQSKKYYHRLGRAWRRSYLLYGPSGTGKSSFIAAVAKFLSFDVYDLDLHNVADDSDLMMLLIGTTNKSVIVIEDLDRFLTQKPTTVSLSRFLNFMDGIATSSCGDERVFVFTANNKDSIDRALLRPGRIDVPIHFPLCNFSSFKSLASSYLGLQDHRLFSQVEEVFSTGAALSAAEIGEIMIENRSSPTLALETVITALNESTLSSRQSMENHSGSLKDGRPPVKELRKLYGLLRLKSTSKVGPLYQDSMTEISKSR